ncbi:MAG: DUF533 domain-containing protein, partial [Candidatus Marinamargulisbacteria bacterium]
MWLLFFGLLVFGGFKTLFAIFGLILALVINFFPLIIVGFFVSRFVRRVGRNRSVNASLNYQSAEYKRFVEIMVHIMIHVAKADGRIDAQETQMIRQFFITKMRFSGGQLTWLNDTIDSATQSSESLT